MIHAPTTGAETTLINVNEVDLEALKVNAHARMNPTRIEWVRKFRDLIEAYNAGSLNFEKFFEQFVAFTKSLNEGQAQSRRESQRGATGRVRPADEASSGTHRRGEEPSQDGCRVTA